MSYRKAKAPRFVMAYFGLLDDPEFRKLSFSAQILYLHMRREFRGNREDPLTFELPHSKMKNVMSSRTMTRSTRELEDAGFIKIEHRGKSCGSRKIKSLYRYTGKWAIFYYKGYIIK